MDWIKRNLIFVVISAVAVLLLLGAGWYLYTGVSKNTAALETLNQEYAELERLNRQNPHPGNDKINNIQAAVAQEKQVRGFMGNVAHVFEPIAPLPSIEGINNASLAESLRRTLDRLQRGAGDAGVQLPDKYAFSFSAIRPLLVFDQGGLAPLATQLGEVKAICDVLFAAKINALDGIRRQRVSTHDREAQQTTDYHERPSVTNEVAVLVPYEVSIRCFSGELGAVLAGFANSKHGFIVKAVNVEPATGGVAGTTPEGAPITGEGFAQPAYVQPPVAAAPVMPRPFAGGEGFFGRPPMPAAPAYAPPAPSGNASGGRGTLPTLVDEKQFKATLLIEVVKLTPRK